jgi:hypothetical protein
VCFRVCQHVFTWRGLSASEGAVRLPPDGFTTSTATPSMILSIAYQGPLRLAHRENK